MPSVFWIGASLFLNSRCSLLSVLLFKAIPSDPGSQIGEAATLAPERPETKIWEAMPPEDLARFVTSGREIYRFTSGFSVPASIQIDEDLHVMRGWMATSPDDCEPLCRLLNALRERDWQLDSDNMQLREVYLDGRHDFGPALYS